jgi:hypothetical protein
MFIIVRILKPALTKIIISWRSKRDLYSSIAGQDFLLTKPIFGRDQVSSQSFNFISLDQGSARADSFIFSDGLGLRNLMHKKRGTPASEGQAYNL